MSRSYTVDASLILNAFLEEPGHEESHSILRRIHEHKNPVIVPTLLLVEVAATVRRRSEDEGLARAFTQALHALPYFFGYLLISDSRSRRRRSLHSSVCAEVMQSMWPLQRHSKQFL